MSWLGEAVTLEADILRLRSLGKSYSSITEELGCSKSLVSYYLSLGGKDRNDDRRRRRRSRIHPLQKKIEQWRCRKAQPIKLTGDPKSSLEKILKQRIVNFSREGTLKEQEFSLDDVLQKFGESPVCYLTGEAIDYSDPSSYHFDHIIPRSRGGDNSLQNLGLATKQANAVKSDLTVEELLTMCEKILKFHGRM